LFFIQHDVSFELATLLPRTLLVLDICKQNLRYLTVYSDRM
jgi:hypothetical protein